jgi:DNA-binding XRE family transcriptional regulator
MKKHPTKGIKIQIGEEKPRLFVLPQTEAEGLIRMLGRYEVKQSVRWKKALKAVLEKHSEGGAVLKAERTMAGWTQVELASRVGVAQHVISEMENGKRPIGKKMALRLAKVFKTDYRLFL